MGIETAVASSEIAPVATIGFGLLIKRWLLGIFIVLLIVNSIYIGIQEKSIEPVIKNIGEKLLLSTQELSTISKQIIANQGAYIQTGHFFKDLFNYILIYGNMYIAIYMIFLWLQIFSWISCKMITLNRDSFIINYGFAIFLFIIFQSILILSYAAVNKSIDCFSGCDNSVINSLETPVMWIVDFFKAVPLLLKPAVNIAQQTITNSTI